ncbi:ATP-binding protein [Agarivorans aestuarii]|uniref:histidine kinase n=1 Tax=Agarivorans aestuarii TaxID=1563703 RepID=A0ABU7G205_9ALTE|nr:ATP-binding protein [Agarivorans aestuarii]MEE1673277.1 ATP-binding protein [Agarivorans aestuarii]
MRTTLAASLATIVILVIVATGKLYHYQEDLESNHAHQQLFSTLSADSLKLIILAFEYTQTHSPRTLKQWANIIEEMKQLLSISVEGNKPHREHIATHKLHLADIDRLLALTEQQMQVFSGIDRPESFSPHQLITTLHQLSNVAYAEQQHELMEVQNTREKIYKLLLTTVIGILVIYLAQCFYIYRFATKPLQKFQEALNLIGHRQFDRSITVKGFSELEEVGISAEKMRLDLVNTTVSRDELIEEIEERKKVEKKNHSLIERLQQSQQQIVSMEKQSTVGSLVGGVAHEINNPLMGCMSYIDYCMTTTKQHEIREVLVKVNDLLERLQRTTRSLLVFARKKSPDTVHSCNIEHMIPRVCELFTTQIRGTSIKFDYPKTVPNMEIGISEDHLEQTILNLLINASHAVDKRPNPKVMLSIKATKKVVSISVIDNGVGISDDVKFKIFDPFFTTKAPEKSTGLGLSTSKQYISEAGGEIVLDSTPNKGTRFSLVFNLRREDVKKASSSVSG